ncbi:hypothetical protein NX761_02090 [Nitrosomonas sp. PLL12]|nr:MULTISPECIES: hypothetical protein [Nitrosomonas]UVS61947.1 hypothetical protein NX761_02090 [Nitrosomonas sp. PLL12]
MGLVDVILEPNQHTACMNLFCNPKIEVDLILVGERKTGRLVNICP